MADGAGSPGHEHGLAVERSVDKERISRRQGRNAQAGAELEARDVRQPNRLVSREAIDLPLSRARRRHSPNQIQTALAEPARVHTFPDSIDHAGTVLVGHYVAEGHRLAGPGGPNLPSVGLTPETATRTRTSPGPGSGRSISITWTTPAGPSSS